MARGAYAFSRAKNVVVSGGNMTTVGGDINHHHHYSASIMIHYAWLLAIPILIMSILFTSNKAPFQWDLPNLFKFPTLQSCSSSLNSEANIYQVSLLGLFAAEILPSNIFPLVSPTNSVIESFMMLSRFLSIAGAVVSTVSSLSAVTSILLYGSCGARELLRATVALVVVLYFLWVNITKILDSFNINSFNIPSFSIPSFNIPSSNIPSFNISVWTEGAVPSATQNDHARRHLNLVFVTVGIRGAALIGFSYLPIPIDGSLWWCAALMTMMPVIQWMAQKDSDPWSFSHYVQIFSGITSKCAEIYIHVLVFQQCSGIATLYLFPG